MHSETSSRFLQQGYYLVFLMKSKFVGLSWQEFLDLRNSLGDVGEWKGEGVTTGIWPGIPAGLKYEISQIIRWNADRTKLLHSYSLKAACGKTISNGAGFITYDIDRKRFYSPSNGCNQGQSYTGNSWLLGFNDKQELWTYEESITEQSYVFRRTINWVSGNEKLITHERTGDPFSFDLMRMMKVKMK
jgi:hypothetical protein